MQETSALSERVSQKVRELDTAQSHAQEAADRVQRLVNRTKAVTGVQQAIAVNDYETAAKYVEEHLQLQQEVSADGKSDNLHPSEQERVGTDSSCPDSIYKQNEAALAVSSSETPLKPSHLLSGRGCNPHLTLI